ncbi:hypothetical protein GW7_21174 [Heterocephalus glaber]|uniref:Uncharacterized protein n=1 Tax=Heterocephalus glaber TaxID=10181 RepID=G5AQ56_HETGA|nr:hypothetical protein GW7_21174 [Heterocephalus glaber]
MPKPAARSLEITQHPETHSPPNTHAGALWTRGAQGRPKAPAAHPNRTCLSRTSGRTRLLLRVEDPRCPGSQFGVPLTCPRIPAAALTSPTLNGVWSPGPGGSREPTPSAHRCSSSPATFGDPPLGRPLFRASFHHTSTFGFGLLFLLRPLASRSPLIHAPEIAAAQSRCLSHSDLATGPGCCAEESSASPSVSTTSHLLYLCPAAYGSYAAVLGRE